MKRWTWMAVVVVGVLILGGSIGTAQESLGVPGFTGEWHPVIGVGGAYATRMGDGKTTTWEMTVVGREGDGYWIEMYLPEMQTIMKTLASPRGVTRSIVKTQGQPAMEMPAAFMAEAPKMDLKQTGQYLGEEQVTTPAGTFACHHYRVTEQSGPADVWVTDQVSPYGLVKMTSPEVSMTLTRVITGASTRITETPQKFQMPNMPNMPGSVSQQDVSNLLQSLQTEAEQ